MTVEEQIMLKILINQNLPNSKLGKDFIHAMEKERAEAGLFNYKD